MKLSEIHINPANPRIIKDDRFKKLVKSISEFPKMLELRPIVVDSDLQILGGNMRFKALQELRYKDIPDKWIKRADELTDEEKRRFIIEDNVPFGEWDWEMLSEWDKEKLKEWGMDIPDWSAGHEVNQMTDTDIDINNKFDPVGIASGLHKIVFIFDNEQESENFMSTNHQDLDYKKYNGVYQVNLSTTYGK